MSRTKFGKKFRLYWSSWDYHWDGSMNIKELGPFT